MTENSTRIDHAKTANYQNNNAPPIIITDAVRLSLAEELGRLVGTLVANNSNTEDPQDRDAESSRSMR